MKKLKESFSLMAFLITMALLIPLFAGFFSPFTQENVDLILNSLLRLLLPVLVFTVILEFLRRTLE